MISLGFPVFPNVQFIRLELIFENYDYYSIFLEIAMKNSIFFLNFLQPILEISAQHPMVQVNFLNFQTSTNFLGFNSMPLFTGDLTTICFSTF
jgi:hypothetical protein